VDGPAGKYPTLQVHPGRRCNLQCLHCYSDSSPSVTEQLDIELLRASVDDAASLGYQVMSVSGTDPATLRAGISEMEQAVALDSTYARAWAALAIASANLYVNGNRDPRVAARAKQALDHAVESEPMLIERTSCHHRRDSDR